MNKERLTAFSDGVIAIIITIMVLELKAPHEDSVAALAQLAPVFAAYVMSFAYVAIYWNNHHHLFQAVHHIAGRTLWANIHLLFWLSLVPFATAWMSETNFSSGPVALYGFSLLMPAAAYFMLTRSLVSIHDENSTLVRALGTLRKEIFSLGLYLFAMALAFVEPRASLSIYVLVALIWFIPDRRVERAIVQEEAQEDAQSATPEKQQSTAARPADERAVDHLSPPR